MPTFSFEERVRVAKAMESAGAAACPRCGAVIETHRLRTTQDKLLKREGKPLYRCGNRACACECTPLSYMTIAPSVPSASSTPSAPRPAAGRAVPERGPA